MSQGLQVIEWVDRHRSLSDQVKEVYISKFDSSYADIYPEEVKGSLWIYVLLRGKRKEGHALRSYIWRTIKVFRPPEHEYFQISQVGSIETAENYTEAVKKASEESHRYLQKLQEIISTADKDTKMFQCTAEIINSLAREGDSGYMGHKHRPKWVKEKPFQHCAAEGNRPCSPRAHGCISWKCTCTCGAVQYVNENKGELEFGIWHEDETTETEKESE